MEIISKKKDIILIVKEQLSSSTTHAIPNIIRSNSWIVKIIWTIAFLLASAVCSLSIFIDIKDYLQYDVTTKTTFIKEFPVIFPGIVICNKDPFVTNTSIQLLANQLRSNPSDFKKYYQSKIPDLELVNKFIIEEDLESLENLKYYGLYQSMKDNKTDIAYNYTEFILDCYFDTTDCKKSDFEPFFDSQNGLCYKFNHKPPFKKLSKVGIFNGLEISLLFGKPTNYLSLIRSSGVVIYIYNQSFSHTEEDRIELNPGTSTSIVISKTYVSKQPYPYSDCQMSPENVLSSNLTNRFHARNKAYNINFCFESCLLLEISKKCACLSYDLSDILDDNDRICESKIDMKCHDSVFFNQTIQDSCFSKCPRACESQKYSFKMFNSLFPSESAKLKILKKFNNSNSFKNIISNGQSIDKVVLNFIIYIDDYYHESISESPAISLEALIGEIGGTLGLFVGISVLSLFEVFEIVFYVLNYTLKKKDKNKSTETDSISTTRI